MKRILILLSFLAKNESNINILFIISSLYLVKTNVESSDKDESNL